MTLSSSFCWDCVGWVGGGVEGKGGRHTPMQCKCCLSFRLPLLLLLVSILKLKRLRNLLHQILKPC